MEEVREKLQPDYDLWHELLLWAEQSFIFSRIYKAILFLLIFQFRSMLRLFVFSLVIRGWSCFLIGLSEAETLQQEGDRNCLYVWFVAVKKIPDNMCLWIVMINELIEDYLPMVAMGLFRHFVIYKLPARMTIEKWRWSLKIIFDTIPECLQQPKEIFYISSIHREKESICVKVTEEINQAAQDEYNWFY